MNIRKNHKFYLGGILLTALLSFSACEELSIGDAVLDRGEYSGPVLYRVYTYTPDSATPAFNTVTYDNQVRLQEDREGLFIEINTVNHHFDKENKIEIINGKNYIKFYRTNNAIDMDTRTETQNKDTLIISLGNGTLEKQ
jgi:hypothetical protein